MTIYRQGYCTPSPLLVEPAWAFVQQQDKKQAKKSPLDAARQRFQESLEKGYEPELTLLYGSCDPQTLLGPEFLRLCNEFFDPIWSERWSERTGQTPSEGGAHVMNIPRETFDAAIAPLRKGINLVEASAGTGKTFAIAMLVLRFVTEFNIPLQGILVVTFTKAATEELKERIRARLASARDLLVKGERRERTEERLIRPWPPGGPDSPSSVLASLWPCSVWSWPCSTWTWPPFSPSTVSVSACSRNRRWRAASSLTLP